MKTAFTILAILLLLLPVRGSDVVSADQFKNIADSEERERIIKQAPPAQKEELLRIDHHLWLLRRYNGEEGLKTAKESYVARARGLGVLEAVFLTQDVLWSQYIASVIKDNKKVGMQREQLIETIKNLDKELGPIRSRQAVVHSLVFNLAPSPAALDLEKKVEKLDESLCDRFSLNGGADGHPIKPWIRRQQLDETDKQFDQIFEQLKRLPKLTPAQAQKEYDEFPEEKMNTKSFVGGAG